MKANELRLGNYVYITDETYSLFYKQETEINIHNLIYLCGETKEPIEYTIEPIPLTEEWLLKFGFKKDNYYGYDEYSIDGYSYINGKFHIAACDECGEDVEINFVHELQNLYFALTKKELTIM